MHPRIRIRIQMLRIPNTFNYAFQVLNDDYVDNEIIVNNTIYDKVDNIFVNNCADDSPVVVIKILI
jgi:hypothetical protein